MNVARRGALGYFKDLGSILGGAADGMPAIASQEDRVRSGVRAGGLAWLDDAKNHHELASWT